MLPTLTVFAFEPPPVFTIVGPLVACTLTVSLPVPLLTVVVVPAAVWAMLKVLPPLPTARVQRRQ